MRVHKNLFGRGDKIHVDEIAVAPGLLLGGAVIVGGGSNANGEWVKFGNGWAVCWGTHEEVVSLTRLTTTEFYNTGNRAIALPLTFIEPPIGFCSMGNTATPNTFLMSASVPDTKNTLYFRPGSPLPRTDITIYVNFFAIGRWK